MPTGAVNYARGAAKLLTEALTTARAVGAGGPTGDGLVPARVDSAFYNHAVTAARRSGAHFSITARMDAAVKKAIGSIEEDAWIPIRYPQAVWDVQGQRSISHAEVAEMPFTAFASRRRCDHVAPRLIVRRVKRLNPDSVKSPGSGGWKASSR